MNFAAKGRALPRSTKKQLRALWLQVHKWIGLTLAVLIIPICLTGSALVWHDWLEAQLEPHAVAAAVDARRPVARGERRDEAVGPQMLVQVDARLAGSPVL